MAKIDFLSPRMIGKRFDAHTIPIEFLKDFAVLEELIIELAKWVFLDEHPGRVRLPRDFSRELSLHLGGVDSGSAVPHFVILTLASLFPESQDCYERARDRIVAAIGAAETDGDITAHLPKRFLKYFDKIGAGLRDLESIEFAPTKEPKATLNKETRRKLILASGSLEEISEDVVLRGLISEADQKMNTFLLQLVDDTRVRGTITDRFRSVLLDAFNGYELGLKVILHGTGRFDRDKKLKGIVSIDQILALEVNDVGARIEELRLLKDGWLDGGGMAMSSSGLDQLAIAFEDQFPSDLLLPYLYPTPEGNVLAEWSLGSNSCSLEVNLTTHLADWHVWNPQTGVEEVKTLDLGNTGDWLWLVGVLRSMASLTPFVEAGTAQAAVT